MAHYRTAADQWMTVTTFQLQPPQSSALLLLQSCFEKKVHWFPIRRVNRIRRKPIRNDYAICRSWNELDLLQFPTEWCVCSVRGRCPPYVTSITHYMAVHSSAKSTTVPIKSTRGRWVGRWPVMAIKLTKQNYNQSWTDWRVILLCYCHVTSSFSQLILFPSSLSRDVI